MIKKKKKKIGGTWFWQGNPWCDIALGVTVIFGRVRIGSVYKLQPEDEEK